MSVNKNMIRLGAFVSFCITATLIGWSYAKIHGIEHKYQKAKSVLNNLCTDMTTTRFHGSHGKTLLPPRLIDLPFEEKSGIVVGTKTVEIRNVIAPYNPSLIASKKGGYDLFFRYNCLNPKAARAPFFYSYIGTVHLNNTFEQGEKEFQRLTLHSEYAEDPRALFVDDQLYLFCDILHAEDPRCRVMCLANLNPRSFETNYMTALDLNIQWMEKNWCPFEYTDPNGLSKLYIEYQMSPRKLFALPDPQVNDLRNIPLSHEAAYSHLPWMQQWGRIQGGTPAQRIGDEYLSFFHSSFKEEGGITWYVMGAYTFHAEPPFTIAKMSPSPILFKGIYDTPIIHTADPQKRVIFPSGFVIEQSNGRELIHLACGENDCAVKIVTLDKEKLLSSMVPFERRRSSEE